VLLAAEGSAGIRIVDQQSSELRGVIDVVAVAADDERFHRFDHRAGIFPDARGAAERLFMKSAEPVIHPAQHRPGRHFSVRWRRFRSGPVETADPEPH